MIQYPPIFGCFLLAVILAVQLSSLKAFAAVLFVTDGNSPLQREFLSKQQPYYTNSLIWKAMSPQGMSLTGFIAPAKLSTADPNERAWAPLQTLLQAGHYTFADLCNQSGVVVVAVGGEAALASIQDCIAPTLIVLTARQQVSQLLNGPKHAALSAIYLEADPTLNLRLLRAILPKAVTVGVFVSRQSQVWLSSLRTAAPELRLKLDEIEAAQDEQAVRELRTRIGGLDALLLLPDTTTVNEWSLKPILLMAVRNYLPTFGGLTESYVNAGVMAAVVPDWDRLHEQITPLVERLAHGVVPPPAYPQATRIVINKTVARTLSIRLDSVEQPLPSPPR